MATKRNLYKPVPASVVNPAKKRTRPTLIQGRLVSSASELTARPRLQQGELNTTVTNQASFLSTTLRSEDHSATPRKTVPIPPPVDHQSPRPSCALDLSGDEESETYFETDQTALKSPRPKSQHHTQVMVLDASALGTSPNGAEVDVVLGYERSKATVICHSPRTGEPAWQIQEDRVPKVSAISPLRSEADLREEIHDEEINKSSRSTRSHRNRSIRIDDTEPKLPQPNFDDSEESEKGAAASKEKVPGPSEATSDAETCSLFEYVPQSRNKKQTPAKLMEKPAGKPIEMQPKKEKKKKGDRIVPSRYMLSSTIKKSGSEKSLVVKNGSMGSSYNSSGPANASGSKKNLGRSQSGRGGKSTNSPMSGKGESAPQGKTSTPTHDHAPVMASCDASAINPELSMMSMFDASGFKSGSGSGNLGTNHGSPRKSKKVDVKTQQQRIDMAYARYVQWAFLDAKATKMLQLQEKDAMRQLHVLWQLMEEKQHEKADLEDEVAKLKHLNVLDQQIQAQHHSLEPVLQMLPNLQKDYSALAAALDTTRHQLLTRGVHIPEEEDFYLAALEDALAESEQLLGNLSKMTQNKAPAVIEFSDAVKAVEKAVDEECKELYRCGELMSAIQSLATQENSLKIQGMQTSR